MINLTATALRIHSKIKHYITFRYISYCLGTLAAVFEFDKGPNSTEYNTFFLKKKLACLVQISSCNSLYQPHY